MWGTDMAAAMAEMLREAYGHTYAGQRQLTKPTYPIGTSTSINEQKGYGHAAPIDPKPSQAYTAGIAIPEEEVHYAAAHQQRLCRDPNTGLQPRVRDHVRWHRHD